MGRLHKLGLYDIRRPSSCHTTLFAEVADFQVFARIVTVIRKTFTVDINCARVAFITTTNPPENKLLLCVSGNNMQLEIRQKLATANQLKIPLGHHIF